MALTSLPFALFAIITGIVYFAYPKKEHRWVILLIASCFFYLYNSFRYSAFILVTILTIYYAACKMDDISAATRKTVKEHKAEWSREEKKAFKESANVKRRRILALTLILNFGILFLLKYFNFMSGSIAALIGASPESAPQIRLLLPLGISFYTFIATGYLIDVYRETVTPERNLFKFALFVSFFPQIIQGPISQYNKLHDQLIEPHDLEWLNFKHGIMNISWGLFKKLVIADCSWKAIKAYYANGGINGSEDFAGYGGTMVLFITLLYALQLYAAVFLQVYQRILETLAYLPRCLDEELCLLSDRNVGSVQESQQGHREFLIRQNTCRKASVQGIHDCGSFIHRIPVRRYLARSQQQIHRFRCVERSYHHAVSYARSCLCRLAQRPAYQ